MRCHILYVVGQLSSGGLERQLLYLLRAMDRSRYLPAVVVWNFHETDTYVSQIRSLGVPLLSFPTAISGAQKLRALCRTRRPQVESG